MIHLLKEKIPFQGNGVLKTFPFTAPIDWAYSRKHRSGKSH